MTAYQAPLQDMRFVLNELAGLDAVARLPGLEDATPELVDRILDEAGRLARDVLAPLNQPGDREGCRLENGVVRTPEGFQDAYKRFVAGGWNGIPFPPDHGGQGLPWLVATAVSEIWNAANMSFALCPMLNQAACELLSVHGSDELKAAYLGRLVAGEWTGTMNLTEPQAGSDLARIRTKAVRSGEAYRLTGQKIFISWGDHDLAENVVHMVLARAEGAPDDIHGLSLFVVPKVLVGGDGSLGSLNDLRCVSLEHKMGIHGSPTCVMSYGDGGGAEAYLVGEENRGIEYMFTMMNNARLAVGLEGVGVAERARQHALAYARERRQGRDAGTGDSGDPVPIIRHADVRRMLLSMTARTEAIRALAYWTAAALDTARRHPEDAVRAENQALVDLLTPVVKAWSTDVAIQVADTGVQVLGGAGYIEESGAPQFLRDVRVTAIYEGTNGIQANDLVRRKVARDEGAAAKALIAVMRETLEPLAHAGNDDVAAIRDALARAIDSLESATDWIVRTDGADPAAVDAGAVPYLRLLGTVAGGWMMARAALAAGGRLAQEGDGAFAREKLVSARFYADQELVQAPGLAATVTNGWAAVGRFGGEA